MGTLKFNAPTGLVFPTNVGSLSQQDLRSALTDRDSSYMTSPDSTPSARTTVWEVIAPLMILAGAATIGILTHLSVSAIAMLLAAIGTRGVESWLFEFSTSPAAAGLAAVLAAFVGASALLIQLAHTRAVERDRAWWDSFRWTTEHGLARDDMMQLPPGVALDTLTALLQGARGAVQKAACKGIVDHLAQIEGSTPTPDEYPEESPELQVRAVTFEEALERWNAAALEAGVAPSYTRARLYEREVFDALRRLLAQGKLARLSRLSKQSGADAEVELPSGQRVRLESALRRPPRAILHQMSRRAEETKIPVLIAHPRSTPIPVQEPGLFEVEWDGTDDDIALEISLRMAGSYTF